jgi:DNA polymerase (family X)
MTNYEIADHLSLMAKLMDLHGENAFRAKSYGIAAYTLEKLQQEVTEMDDAQLFGIKGIGDSMGRHIRELQNTGTLTPLQEILAHTPQGVLEIMQIKGLGPKKVAVIWKDMGIESVGELEYACNENRLVNYKGFGAKTQEAILQNIRFIRANQGFHLWAEVHTVANMLLTQLGRANAGKLFSLAGAFRRQMPTVECIDIVTDTPAATIKLQFGITPDIKIEEQDNLLLVNAPNQPLIKVHCTDTASFYTTLFNNSCSEAFLNAFNERYKIPANPSSEEAIFETNGLQYIPAAQRETVEVLHKAAKNGLQHVIQPADIKGIVHNHSTWSDGMNTIADMAKACIDKGYEYLVISDHSQSAYYANGLSPERIAAQQQEIDNLNTKLAPFRIFKSVEADILGDGSLDYNESVLKTFDLVIASVHSNLQMTQERAMERVLAAIRNPYTTILGHPTGRLLLSREGYPLDHQLIIDECVKHNVVIEINAHPRRLDLDWTWVEYAMQQGALLSIDPDAHVVGGFDDVYFGVMAAQKGGLTAKHNLSSFSLKEFEEHLAKKHKP